MENEVIPEPDLRVFARQVLDHHEQTATVKLQVTCECSDGNCWFISDVDGTDLAITPELYHQLRAQHSGRGETWFPLGDGDPRSTLGNALTSIKLYLDLRLEEAPGDEGAHAALEAVETALEAVHFLHPAVD